MIRDGIQYTDGFDGDCYLARYPDVAADGKYDTPEKAYAHWLNFGQFENRIPGCEIGPVKPGDTGGGAQSDQPAGTDTTPAQSSNTNHLLWIGGGLALAFLFRKQLRKFFSVALLASVASMAFSQVEGFGSAAIGGANSSTVYHVLNSNNNGPGSFAAGIGSNKTIVFEVDAVIGGNNVLQNVSFLTIDGNGHLVYFNSNGNGDCLSFDGANAHNIVVKNIHAIGGGGDGINVVNGAHDVAIVNCTVYGNQDGNIDIGASSDALTKNVTVQFCVLGKGASGWSGDQLITGQLISIHHNLYIPATPGEVGERCPLVHCNYSPVGNPNADIRNNVIYKWGRNNATGSGYAVGIAYQAHANVVNNYFYSTQSIFSATNTDDGYGNGATGRAFMSGNVSGNAGVNPNDRSNSSLFVIPASAEVSTQDACTAAAIVKAMAGARPLDATDAAILNSVQLFGCNAVTPVMLTRFVFNERRHELQWTTATEINNDRFEIQESIDGNTWYNAGTVKSSAPDGNSTQLINYSYVV